MDGSDGLKFLPIKFTKSGNPDKTTKESGALQTLEDFGKLMNDLCQKVAEIGNAIKKGECRILPLKDDKEKIDACKYCAMKPICRNFTHKQTNETEGGNADV